MLVSVSPAAVDDEAGRWETVATTGGGLQKRHEACFVMVDGRGYLVGGRGQKRVDVYDPERRSWSRRDGYGQALHHMQCVGYDGGVWIASSWTGGFPREENVADVVVYNTRNDTWTTRRGLPEARRRGGAASVLRGGRIYVVGGNRGGHGEHATTLGWMDAYDIAADAWETGLAELPQARDHVGGALVGGRLCVGGGRDSGTRSFFKAGVRSAWCYDFGARVWVRGDDVEEVRAGAATAAVCGEMMLAGGEGGAAGAAARVDFFDGERWRRARDLRAGRHGTGVAVWDGGRGAFVASGSGGRGGGPELDSVEHYTRAGGCGA